MDATRFCRGKNHTSRRSPFTRDVEALRDYIANVTAVQRSYRAQLHDGAPTRLSPQTLGENIRRCDASLARLHQELEALQSNGPLAQD